MITNPFKISADDGTYKNGKLVGGYVPQPYADYLHLLALYKGKSIQGVLQDMIQEWMEQNEPYQSIIEVLADRSHMEWIRRDWDISFYKKYEREIQNQLKRRKINTEDIHSILKELRNRIGVK